MGLHRDIEKMLERPRDALLLRQILAFWAEHRYETLTVSTIASLLLRPVPHVEGLLAELAELGVLSRLDRGSDILYRYRLVGGEASAIEQFARSKGFHEKRLANSTDKFRAMYHRKASE